MTREELFLMLRETLEYLSRDNCQYVVNINTKKYIFNLITSKGNRRFVARISNNIDSCRKEIANELRKLAYAVRGIPLIVGKHSKNNPLLDGVLYRRFDVYATSHGTFIDILLGRDTYIYAERGGFFVKIEHEKLREIRERKGYSLGELAEMVGVSRRTIYGYERGEMDPTPEVALKLEEALGETIIRPFDLNYSSRLKRGFREEEQSLRDPILRKVEKLMKEGGFSFTTFKKAPFDAAALKNTEEGILIKNVEQEKSDKDLMRDLEVTSQIASISESKVMVVCRKGIKGGEIRKTLEDDFIIFSEEEINSMDDVSQIL